MIRIDCPSCSGVSVPCPTCHGLGWLLRPGISDGARGLRLETLREASAAWAGVVRGIVGSTARASRVLDCSPATLRNLLPAAVVDRPEVAAPSVPDPPSTAGSPAVVPSVAAVPAPVDPDPVARVVGPSPDGLSTMVDLLAGAARAIGADVRVERVPTARGPADRGPAGCVPGCVSPAGHRGWHTGPDGRPWRGARRGDAGR